MATVGRSYAPLPSPFGPVRTAAPRPATGGSISAPRRRWPPAVTPAPDASSAPPPTGGGLHPPTPSGQPIAAPTPTTPPPVLESTTTPGTPPAARKATLMGFNQDKYDDPTHNTAKYSFGRYFSPFGHTPGDVGSNWASFQQADPRFANWGFNGKDTISWNGQGTLDDEFKGITAFDVINSAGLGGRGLQFNPTMTVNGPYQDPSATGTPSAGVPPTVPVSPSGTGSPFPTITINNPAPNDPTDLINGWMALLQQQGQPSAPSVVQSGGGQPQAQQGVPQALQLLAQGWGGGPAAGMDPMTQWLMAQAGGGR